MASLKITTIVALTAGSLLSAGIAAPAFAGEARARVDASRLDKAPAEYSYYRSRGGWRGNRGAAVAGAVGLGILGAAAIAASRPAYADPYYGYDEGYSYGAYEPAYGYEAPPVVYQPRPRYYGGYYGPGNYYSGRGPYTGFYNGAPDPSRGGR